MRAAIREAENTVVGCYRIRQGASLELTRDEVQVASSVFREPGSVVLLIERRPGTPAANFFFLDRGSLLNVALPAPLDAATLARIRVQPGAAAEEKSVPPAAPTPVRARPAAAAPVAATRQARFPILATAICIGLVLLSAALYLGRPRGRGAAPAPAAGAPPASPSPLRAERQGDDLKIVWDLNSLSVAEATSGVLDIDDGGVTRQIQMTADQVRFGSVLYSPASSQISLQLTTLKGDQTTAEASVLVLLNKPSPTQSPAAGDRSPRIPFEVKTQPLTSVRPFVPPPPVAAKKSAPVPFEPPSPPTSIVAGVVGGRNVPPSPIPASTLPPVALPAPAVTAAPPSAPAKPPEQPPAIAPAARIDPPKPQPENYVSPVLVTLGSVRMPPELPGLLKPLSVSVRVDLNQSGHVTRAQVIPEKGVHNLILRAVEEAAWKCHFQPARRGQTPVPSSMTIVFHLNPEGR